MSSRKRIQRKNPWQPTPAPDILKSRPFSNGLGPRESKLPTTNDILQTRPFSPRNKDVSTPKDTRSFEEKMKGAEFRYNGVSIPAVQREEVAEENSQEQAEGETSAANVSVFAPSMSPPPENSILSPFSFRQTGGWGQQETLQREEVAEEEVEEQQEVGIQKQQLEAPPDDGTIQRLCAECEGELADKEEKEPIQAKLTVGEAGDKYEQEADAVADQVVEKINAPQQEPSVQRQSVNRKVNSKSQQVSHAKTPGTSLQSEIYIQRDSKVSGTKGVTPDIGIKVLENMSRGEPPFRPDLSLGGCEWMVSEGNPYVGIGAEKSVTLPVEAIRPDNPLIFQESDLVEIFNQKINAITDAAAEAEFRREARIPEGQPLNSKQRKNASGRFKERMAEKRMWEEVGSRVRSSETKVGEVVLQDSRFSKQGNGKFLVVADRTKITVKGGIPAVVEALEKSGATAEPIVKEAAQRLISQRNAGRVRAVFKYGGRILIVVGIAAEGYKIYHAQNKVKAVVESAGGWAGAWAAGSAFAAWFSPADAAGPWAWLAHGVGTLVAGGVGYWIGSETTRTIYELVLEE